MITKVSRHSDFVNLKENWNGLLESSEERDNVFLRHEWFDAWWQAFGKDKEMFILVCRDQTGALAGVAPLMIFKDSYKGFPYNRIGFIEDANAPSMNFIVKRGDEEAIIPAMLDYLFSRENKSWHVAVLNKIPASSVTISISQRFFCQNGIRFLLRDGQNSPYIPVNSDWKAFLGSTSVRFRKQLRNKINKLNSAGEITFDLCKDAGVDAKHLNKAMSVSSRSWKDEGRTAMGSTTARRKFFELLSDVAGRNGWLRIWFLCLKGEPIAMEYHLEYKGRTHAMRGDFDKSLDHLSPGSILEAQIIEHCFRDGLLEYDFCGLPFGYKLRWTSVLHERNNVLLYQRTQYSSVLYFMQKWLPRIHKKVLEWKNAKRSAPAPRSVHD